MTKLQEQLENLINRTPTGADRNLLTDLNIALRSNHLGFTEEEQAIMDVIGQAWDKFNAMSKTHSDEQGAYLEHIHGLQKILAMRILRRDYPKLFYSSPGKQKQKAEIENLPCPKCGARMKPCSSKASKLVNPHECTQCGFIGKKPFNPENKSQE